MRHALILALLACPATAQNIDMSQGGPVDITSTDGIEWRQEQRVVIARGNARAVRDGVTVNAARLLARYRPQAGAGAQPAPATAAESWAGGASEQYAPGTLGTGAVAGEALTTTEMVVELAPMHPRLSNWLTV